MRTHEWLENRFEYIYREYFSDVEATNQIEIVWGKRSRRQLGCIKKAPMSSLRAKRSNLGLPRPLGLSNDKFTTIIVINGLFKDEAIPEFVIDAVIVHEMAHYAHGFNSPLPQIHKNPHKGKVIRREFLKRGIGDLERKQEKWMKENWATYLEASFPSTRKPKIRYKIIWK